MPRVAGVCLAESGDWLRRMQKSLDQMNVRVHRAVSDLEGAPGMAILRSIAEGERDARKLARLRDRRCRQSEEQIAEQLSGHWREDHLFSLRQALKMYDAIQERIAAYEKEILGKLQHMGHPEQQGQTAPPLENANKAQKIKKHGQEAKRQALYRMSGVDATQIDAIGVDTVEVVISEYGLDLSRFPTEKQFVSHATLAPHVIKSGGKSLKKRKRNSASTRVAAALRMAALSLRHSQTALGAYYRSIAKRIGGGRSGLCYRPEVGDPHLSTNPLGTALRRRRRGSIRKQIPSTAPSEPDSQGQSTRISTHCHNHLTPKSQISFRLEFFPYGPPPALPIDPFFVPA